MLDYGSIWFTTKDGTTFKIAKTQCVNYKGVSKSSSDIGASLGDPKYSKLVGLDVVKAFIDLVLWPVSSLAAKCLIYTLENLQCSLTAIFDIIRLIAAGDFNTLGQMAATVAIYMVGYKLALLVVGAVIGVSSGLILMIALAFGTAVFMLLVDLVKVGFNLNVYMEQRELESYEDLTAYLLSQIAADVIYNFLIANFLKFAKKAKAKASPKVENIINKVTGKVTEAIDNAINKVKDTVDNIVNKVDDVINKGGNCYKLSQDQLNAYLSEATKNPNSDTFVLGLDGNYDVTGGLNDYTYFKMNDSTWNKLKRLTNYNYDEIWKLNKKFIDKQISSGKNIVLTNNPNSKYYLENGSLRFYQREINYLKELGYVFKETSDGLWKAVK